METSIAMNTLLNPAISCCCKECMDALPWQQQLKAYFMIYRVVLLIFCKVAGADAFLAFFKSSFNHSITYNLILFYTGLCLLVVACYAPSVEQVPSLTSCDRTEIKKPLILSDYTNIIPSHHCGSASFDDFDAYDFVFIYLIGEASCIHGDTGNLRVIVSRLCIIHAISFEYLVVDIRYTYSFSNIIF